MRPLVKNLLNSGLAIRRKAALFLGQETNCMLFIIRKSIPNLPSRLWESFNNTTNSSFDTCGSENNGGLAACRTQGS